MIITFIAITWPILIGAAYEEVCDGPYINSVEKKKNNCLYKYKIY